MKGGLGQLMKQAQAMQENLRKAQAELATIEVDGQAGGGLVRVTITCRNNVRKVHLDETLLKEDREVLEDLLTAAMNDAIHKAEQVSQERLSGLAAGLDIPGLGLPF